MSAAQLSRPADQGAVPPGSPDEAIRRTVLRLNALSKSATLQFTLAVGELVVTHLYSGDIRRLRSRQRKDHLALRRVAADPDLAMSASALFRCVAIYEMCERIGARSWRHVSTTHLRAVLGLEPDAQEQLLREAEVNRWGVRELEKRVAVVADTRPPARNRGGRKRRTRLRTLIEAIHKKTVEFTDILALGEGSIPDLSPETARAAVDALERMKDACNQMVQRLTRPRTDLKQPKWSGDSVGTGGKDH
jgi:hypothetical protein